MAVLLAGHSFTRRVRDFSQTHAWTPGPAGTIVHFCFQGGAYIEGPRSIKHRVEGQVAKLDPSYICLDLGSNDLDAGADPAQLATTYVEWAGSLARRYSKQVTILQALPRRETLFPGSHEATVAFNLKVRELVSGRRGLHYWMHRGFWAKTDSPLLDRKGVHPSTEGLRKYAQSNSKAINHMINHPR